MKNFKNFENSKYNGKKYQTIEDFIYKYKDKRGDEYYCTPLTFEQEPELDEGVNSKNISQYPLEDVLDKFYVHVSDFFDDLNNGESNVCYLEFSGSDLEDVQKLKESVVGKRVFNETYEEDGEEYVKLVIE